MRRTTTSGWCAWCAVLLVGATGCGGTASDAAGHAGGEGPFGPASDAGVAFNGGSGAGGNLGSGGSAAPDVASLPPETEQTVDLQLPQASENFVYATNPSAGTVSVIDAKTLQIQPVETGDQPTYLRTLAGTDNAIVLNIGSDTATVIRSSTTSASKAADLPVVSGANAIGVAPDGKHAVVYRNSTYASAGNRSGSFQDVSVLTLSADGKTDASVSMTVGFLPRDVFFAANGKRAFVVTRDGVSVLDFAQIEKSQSGIARLVAFGGGVDQKTLDVAVTPDGLYALAREEGKSVLRLVDLTTGNVKTLDVAKVYAAVPVPADDSDAGTPAVLPVEITDLDMLPDGSAALAVLRNQNALITLPLPGAFSDASTAKMRLVPGEIVGSVTVGPDANTALLYTTAANIERITIVDLSSSAAPRTVALQKAVQAVAFTPSPDGKGNVALITHTKLPGDPNQAGLSVDDQNDRSFGYSMLRLPEGDVKLQITKTALGPVAMVPATPKVANSSFLFILFRDDALGVKEVYRVSLTSFIADPIIQLESPPISIGIAPSSKKVFVNQDHPDGRMTFISWQNPDLKNTVTGFELNSRIRD